MSFHNKSIHAEEVLQLAGIGAQTLTAFTIYVRKNPSPGQFSSVAAALASLTVGAGENWVIDVGPGVYTEPQLVLPVRTILKGAGPEATGLKASDPTNHFILGKEGSAIVDLMVDGPTNTDRALIFYQATVAGGTFVADNVLFGNADVLVNCSSDAVASAMFINNARFGGQYTFRKGFIATSVGASASRLQVRNTTTNGIASPTPEVVFLADQPNCQMILSNVQCRSTALTTGPAVQIQNGAIGRFSGLNVRNFGTGLYVPAGGATPTVNAGSVVFETCTKDLDVEHTSTLGSIMAAAQESKVTNLSSTFGLVFLDPMTGTLCLSDNMKLRQSDGTFTDVSTLIEKSGTMGVVDGGEITAVSGFTVEVAAGFGYLDEVPDDLRRVDWPTTQITIPTSSVAYLFFDENAVLQQSPSEPSNQQKILLGRVITNSSGIFVIDESPVNAAHASNRIYDFTRDGLGGLYASGSVVTENGVRQLNITNGTYFFGTNKFTPTGGTAVTWSAFSHNGSGQFVHSSQSTVDNAQWDTGTGLSALTASYYAKHSLYVVGQGSKEKYLLVYSQAQYASLVIAEGASLPAPPTYFEQGIVPIASIIVQQGNANIVQVRDERPIPGSKASGISASADHGNLLGLLDDDHPQYLLINGTRAMTGTLNMGGNQISNAGNINGVSITAHASRHLPGGADALTTAAPTTSLSATTTNAAGAANSFSRSDHSHAILTGTPSTLTPDQANAVGTSANLARADHIHQIATAAPVQATADGSNGQGSSTSFSRADHKHDIATAAPVALTPNTGNVAGVSTSVARADHQHNIATAAAVGLDASSTNTQGSSTSFARADHTHAISTGAPIMQTPDQTNAVGTSANLARADHVHNIPTAAPTSTLSPASTNAQGAATSFARSDHSHAVATALVADITSVQAGNTAAAGTADNYARGDHRHAVATGVASQQTPDQTNAEGSSPNLARADHVHNIPTAAAVGLDANSANGQGNATSFARSNHTHAIATGAPSTQNADAANAAGTSVNLARADHVHNIPTAAPVNVADANSQGTANTFAKSDHVHAHGSQTNPAHHAVATQSANGFMSSADKTKLDGISGARIFKSGVIPAASFTGTPRKATLTFGTAFPNTNYQVVVLGADGRFWSYESQLAASIVLNSNAAAALTGPVFWIAMNTGESVE